MTTTKLILIILFKIWLAGVVLIPAALAIYCIYWLIYDWRWYFKWEMPPASVAKEVRELIKAGTLKESVKMNVEIIKDKDGVVFAAIMRFEGTGVIGFCDTIGRKFEMIKRDFCVILLLILLWPICPTLMIFAPLVDKIKELSRRRK